MIYMWDLIVVIYFSINCAFVLILIYGWQSIQLTSYDALPEDFVSVIVPCRNEESNIVVTLEDLGIQNYPRDKFEVLVVNDNSVDNTPKIVQTQIDKTALDLSLINLQNNSGKKQAITEGVKASKGNLIVVTDADCRREKEWLQCLVANHLQNNNKISFGLVTFSDMRSTLSRILSLEQRSLIGSSAAFWKLGSPIMANGANMIFAKEDFLKVKGFEGNEHIPSGDDEFLLTKFRKYKLKVGFIIDKKTTLDTTPPRSWRELLDQRLRWAGKWSASNNIILKLIAIFVFLLQLGMLALVYGVVAGVVDLAYFLLGLSSKVIVNFIFLKCVSARMSKRIPFWPFILLEIVYPIYVLFFALISNFRGYSWKGRYYAR